MVESQAKRIHKGDNTLKRTKRRRIVNKSRSAAAKAENSPLTIWRKVSKDYLKKGGFVTLPKIGTKEHKALYGLYLKELEKSRR